MGNMSGCRRRDSGTGFLSGFLPQEDVGTGWRCRASSMVFEEDGSTPPPATLVPAPAAGNCEGSCLCVFDIDRTLTGKQSGIARCPENRLLDFYDAAYGGGTATLSALADAGINTTFCNGCYLGITSAGTGSGEQSPWNKYILEKVMRGDVQDDFTMRYPESKTWSFGMKVQSPYVLAQPDGHKQRAVEKVRRWYGESPRGICIVPQNVYFFGDRTENIMPFAEKEINSKQASCASRDEHIGNGMVGYCGATPQEIQRTRGNVVCKD